ncbi:glycosyltransferase family protein [Amnibacterium setariae]|uniref:Spore protein YkvP/CgeB glycosyl transferase-like domain-containing protein n=1 Tax=Amnibacterium setariae TaxID=2306585 RepID=A0A3A1TWJ3_9MICO|nr:hypothetical protein [Amnibacterium setariae]RIX26089.1 hypothetical protein D1781_17265 [Amnibacterium setariae]
MAAPRVLWVPNEIGDALQSGFRRAFADLLAIGAVAELEVFSLERRIRAGGDAAAHRADLLAAAERFRPDLVLLQHVGYTGLTDGDIDRLLRHGASMVYHEGDPYTRRLHPLPPAARAAGRRADVVFTCGAGVFAANFRRSGAKRVEWVPSAFDPARVDASPKPAVRDLDLVMIANRSRARVRPLPAAADRRRFVELLQQRHGRALGLYGNGWTGPSARGALPYPQQSAVMRTAWLSANWDHFSEEPCYFSDRLPIALASGSLHAATLHPGYGAVFPPETSRFLITGSSPEDLVTRIDRYLTTTSPDERVDAEEAARRFAWRHFRQDDQLVTLLNAVGAGIDPARAAAAWDLTTAPVTAG